MAKNSFYLFSTSYWGFPVKILSSWTFLHMFWGFPVKKTCLWKLIQFQLCVSSWQEVQPFIFRCISRTWPGWSVTLTDVRSVDVREPSAYYFLSLLESKGIFPFNPLSQVCRIVVYRKSQPCRLVTIETLITILTIENLNSWQSLLPENLLYFSKMYYLKCIFQTLFYKLYLFFKAVSF